MSASAELLTLVWSDEAAGRVQALLDKWCRDLDYRDNYSGLHSGLATQFALMLARRLRLDGKTRVGLWVAGHVYDFGKIAVPEEVLRKDGTLSDAEQMMMRRHVTLGCDLLRDWRLLREGPRWLQKLVLDVVRYHHERWDGAGYPEGRRGDDIPLAARIMAIADAYAAMTMDSPYRRARPSEKALEELEANSGTQFDPTLVPQFVAVIRVAMRDGSLDVLRAMTERSAA